MAPVKKHGIGKGLMTQAKKHGIGKGLMTVWRATNPDGGDIPTGIDYTEREVVVSPISTSTAPKKPQHRVKRSQQAPVAVSHLLLIL